jgi:twitching motility two-component system response regulator PilH
MLAGLGKAGAVVLWLYTALRLGDLAVRGSLAAALVGSWQSGLFVFELLILAVIPAALLSSRRLRGNAWGVGTAAVLVVCGVILNRLSTSIFVQTRPEGPSYFPTWIDLAVSLGVVSAAALVFMFCVEHFKAMEGGPQSDAKAADPYAKPAFGPQTHVSIDPHLPRLDTGRALGMIGAAGVAVAALWPSALHGYRVPRTPVFAARGGTVLKIDGNRAKEFVSFDHRDHMKRLGGDESCKQCHHLSKPEDGNTSCCECHADMYLPSSLFAHDLHIRELGDAASCDKCHGPTRDKSTAKPCSETQCHSAYAPGPEQQPFNHMARSYVDAMHDLCIACHEKEASRVLKPRLSECHLPQAAEREAASSTTMKKEVLVIDDELDSLRYLVAVLEDEGYEVLSCQDGDEGLALAAGERPDLVLIDIMMPRKSGLAIYRAMRAEGRLRDLPVILVSGVNTEQEYSFRALVADENVPEPQGYAEKPINLPDFLAKVGEVLAGSHPRTRSTSPTATG